MSAAAIGKKCVRGILKTVSVIRNITDSIKNKFHRAVWLAKEFNRIRRKPWPVKRKKRIAKQA